MEKNQEKAWDQNYTKLCHGLEIVDSREARLTGLPHNSTVLVDTMTNLLKQQLRTGCFCHNPEDSAPNDPFERAWKAVEDGETSALKQAIQEIKEPEANESEQTSKLKQAIKKIKEKNNWSSAPLDTCRLIDKKDVTYSMSLLALCGFHGRMDMVDLLLQEGADMNANCACRLHKGTPVSQLMLHCLIEDKYAHLSRMLEYFIQKRANLNVKLTFRDGRLHQMEKGKITGHGFGMLDLSLSMKRIDCAKVIVKAGVDLISGGFPEGETFDVVPMFQEYYDHGTNEFIHWAFKEFIPQLNENDLKRIIHCIINMKKKDETSYFWQCVQRAPAHAVLTCLHKEAIERLVECAKKSFDGLDLLAERSCTGKTALHVAAENNDVESVQILLQLGAYTRASDNSDMNPFMIAVEKSHLEVAKILIRKDPGLMSMPLGSGSTVIHWALEKGCSRSAFFEACFEENAEALLKAKDCQGNTIAHLVAASGNTEVFEILWSGKFAEAVISNENCKNKTPLQLAVEKGHVSILQTLKTCIDGGRVTTKPGWHRKLKSEWWSKVVPYFLYACSCGSLDTVKYLIDSGKEPNVSHKGKTPLLCAAEAGHDEIVAYLLEFREVQTYLKNQPSVVMSANASPLLIAAQNGHTKCVTLLLEKGGNVLQRDSEDRNCLILAIQNHHKATALAILSDKEGLNAVKTAQKKDKTPTPLHLLVKEMPDLAEYVLNKCITQGEREQLMPQQQQVVVDGEDDVDGPTVTAKKMVQSVKFNFDFLESSHLEGSEKQFSHKHHSNHIDEPESEQQIPHTHKQDFKDKTITTMDQLDSDEQLSHEHHDERIDEPELRRRIVTDEVDFVDAPTVGGEKLHCQKFCDQDDKDRQIPHSDLGNHILDWMMNYNRLELLQHPLVENFLCQKFWSTAFPLFLLNLLFYLSLLVALNWFALVVPRPGPDSETCPESEGVAFNGTSSGCQGQSGSRLWFLAVTAFLLYMLSILGFLMEVVQLVERKWKYFKDSDNYFQLALYFSTVIFIDGFDNACWCSTPWQWQIGALAVFLSWFNFIFILKYLSYTAIPINMFLSICVKFLKMIFLPIVLILAFGVPHYMVFVRTKKEESLPAFKSSGHAIAKTLLQLAGEFDFEATFNQGDLLYSPTTYILFITFLITMPILFINLLNALAVGETQEITMNAELTTLKLQVELIQEQWGMKGLLTILEQLGIKEPLPFLKRWQRKQQCICLKTEYTAKDDSTRPVTKSNRWMESIKHYLRFVLMLLGSDYHKYVLGKDYAHHARMAKELEEKNEDIYNTVMGQNPVREDITELKEDINTFKQEMMAQRDDIAKMKEDLAKLVQALTPSGGN